MVVLTEEAREVTRGPRVIARSYFLSTLIKFMLVCNNIYKKSVCLSVIIIYFVSVN